jgi:putative endonuclease
VKQKAMIFDKRKTGISGENDASRFLEKAGYTIIKRNYRTRLGEIDIIIRRGDTLVFVEVKTSRIFTEDTLEYTVHNAKKKKILLVSQYFLVEYPEYNEYIVRYDVIFVSKKDNRIMHIENAFGLNMR